jgi:microsomal dipeptidase-like Zn-dependent dipeptidase
LTSDYAIEGYESFADWPNVTLALARWGFNEEELRKLLGLNFLRVFREVVG